MDGHLCFLPRRGVVSRGARALPGRLARPVPPRESSKWQSMVRKCVDSSSVAWKGGGESKEAGGGEPLYIGGIYPIPTTGDASTGAPNQAMTHRMSAS